MITSDTSAVAAVEDITIPAPDDCKPFDGAVIWPGGYIRSLRDARGRGAPARAPAQCG